MTGMRVLAIGSGGVGTSAALIAARRDFFESWICADYDEARARAPDGEGPLARARHSRRPPGPAVCRA